MDAIRPFLRRGVLCEALVFFSSFLFLPTSSLQAQHPLYNGQQYLTLAQGTSLTIHDMKILSGGMSTSFQVPAEGLLADSAVLPSGFHPEEGKAVPPLIASSGQVDEPPPPAVLTIRGDEATTEKMFGERRSGLHPFATLEEKWSDNLFNINIDQVDSFVTVASAGLWYSLPRLDEVPVSLTTQNTAIGGTRFTFTENREFERFQAYIMGGVEYGTYSYDAGLDNYAWRMEALYQQNLPAGISLRLVDRFAKDRDQFDIGSFLPSDFTAHMDKTYVSSTPSFIRTYYSNLANLGLKIGLSPKFSAGVEYTNFFLDYTDGENDWLDRTDNRFSLSVSYRYSPKTSFFIDADKVLISYGSNDTGDGISSSYYAGIDWQGSEKTLLRAKAGWQQKEYDFTGQEQADTLTTEVHLNYMLTDKTKMSLNLYKALEETNSLTNSGLDTIAAIFHYEQRFSYRFLGQFDISYEKNDYEGFTRTTFNDTIESRQDTSFSVRPSLQYTFREWLVLELAYMFENRNSNDNFYDYTTQTISLDINSAL